MQFIKNFEDYLNGRKRLGEWFYQMQDVEAVKEVNKNLYKIIKITFDKNKNVL